MVKEQKVVLRPNKFNGVFNGVIDIVTPQALEKYADKKDKRRIIITRDNRVIWQRVTDPIPQGDKLFINFKERRLWDWTWKEDGSVMSKQIKEVIDMIALHTKVEVRYGNKNINQIGDPDFILEFQSNQALLDAKILIKKSRVMQKWDSFSHEQKIDCAYAYGVNASKYSAMSAIYNVMVDYTSGILMSPNKKDRNDSGSLSFIDDFLEKYTAGSPEKSLEALAEKAIIRKVFAKRDTGYYYEEQYVGKDKGDIFSFLNQSDQITAYVKEAVGVSEIEDDMSDGAEDMPTEETLERAKKLRVSEASKYTEAELLNQCSYYETVRNKAKELGIKNWSMANIETLREETIKKTKEMNE